MTTSEPEDGCWIVDVDGEPVRVRTDREPNDESREYFAEVVRAAKRRLAEPGGRVWRLDLGERTPLSLNGPRGNYYVHARAVKAMRRLAWARACEAKIPRLGRVSIELHYAPRDKRRRDPFNLVATLKPCEDGIVDAGVIPDDTPQFSEPTVPVIHAPTGRRGRMWLIIRELEECDV